MDDILIGGAPFWALHHHDGRFVRAPGLFAFARRGALGRYEVLHLELAEAINRAAGPCHDRWAWALAQGMDSLLMHLFGARRRRPAWAQPDPETVTWAPGAQVRMHGFEDLGLVLAGLAVSKADRLAARR
jgi:hypothetical protein